MRALPSSGIRNYTALLLFCLVWLVGCVAAPRIGAAWDEPDNIHSGGVYWRYFRSGFNPDILTTADQASSVFSSMIFTQEPTIARYPPVPNVLGTAAVMAGAAVGYPVTDKHIITVFHMVAAGFLALLVAYAFRWAVLAGLSYPLAVVTALFVWFYPTLFGHGYSNVKDIAQVSLFTVSLYYLVRGMAQRRKGDLVKGAVVWGIGLATKINVIYVPVIWGCWVLATDLRLALSGTRPTLSAYLRRRLPLLGILPIGFMTMIAVWPYLWTDTIVRIAEVLRYFTSVGQGYRVYWDGAFYQVGAGQSMWWYPLANLVLLTPLPLLVCMVLGIGVTIAEIRHARSRQTGAAVRLALLFWLVIPLLRSLHPYAAFYDGVRHFLEIVPALLLLAGWGLAWSGGLFRRYRYGAAVAGAGIVLFMAFINLRFFPYSAGYYNVLARNPNQLFERDIEGLAVREGVEYLKRTYGNIRLWVPVAGHLSWYYVTTDDMYVYNDWDADSLVIINKRSHLIPEEFVSLMDPSYRLVHTISRGDAVFGWVYRRVEPAY